MFLNPSLKKLKKSLVKVCLEDGKGRMFAAAKKGNALGRSSVIGLDDLIGKVRKKLFQKKTKKYCGIGKRVLYLHPLSKETSWGKIKRSS